MNGLDFLLAIGFLAIFVSLKRYGALVSSLAIGGGLLGFVAGLLLAPTLFGSINNTTSRGILALVLAIVLGVGAAVILHLGYGKKLHMKLLVDDKYLLDKRVSYLTKPLLAVLCVIILASSLPQLPITPLRFVSQGSTILFNANRFLPSLPDLQARVAGLDQNTFSYQANLQQDLAVANVADPIAAQAAAVAASATVRVSGPICAITGATGSGFVVEQNLVITNAHVIHNMREVYIETDEGRYPATPLAVDTINDIAVLYSAYLPNLAQLAIHDTTIQAENPVIILGYPGGGPLTIDSAATVLSVEMGRNSNYAMGTKEMRVLKLNGITRPGNSGGPVVDQDGVVTGVVFASDGKTQTSAATAEAINAALAAARRAVVPVRVGC